MRFILRSILTIFTFLSPALLHGMETKKTHQEQSLAEISAQECRASAQVENKRKTNQSNLVKTVLNFSKLPKSLQEHIHTFNQKIICTNVVGSKGWSPRECINYQDDKGCWKAIAVSYAGGTMRVLNLSHGEEELRIETGHHSTIWSIAIYKGVSGWKAITASADSTLRVWDLGTGTLEHILRGHTDEVTQVAVYQDAEGWKAISASEDNTMRIWNLITGDAIYTFEGQAGEIRDIKVYRDATGWKAVCFYRLDGALRIWDLATGELLNTINAALPSPHGYPFDSVAIYQEGTSWKAIAPLNVGKEKNKISCSLGKWDLKSGKLLQTIQLPEGIYEACVTIYQGSQGCIAVIAAKNSGKILIYDVTTDRLLQTLIHKDMCRLAVSQGAADLKIISACSDTLSMWEYGVGDAEQAMNEVEFTRIIKEIKTSCSDTTAVALCRIIGDYALPADTTTQKG